MINLNEILIAANLKVTPCRLAVLKILQQSPSPLSQGEIAIQKSVKDFDKVTLYRTLETLKNKKLIHRSLSTDGIWRFCAQKSSRCHGNHIHFSCTHCLRIFCMPEVKLPKIEAPHGMEIFSKQLLVQGLCDRCNKKGKAK